MKIRTAYLVSRYPAVSHTFILREVLALRRLGIEIKTASVNPPDRTAEQMTAEEQVEAAGTFYIKSQGKALIAAAHLRTLLASPGRYLSGLLYALKLGGSDFHAILYHLFYFVEAVVLGDWMRREQLEHVHVHFATPAATVAMIARQCFAIEFSMTVHGPDEFYEVERYHLAEKVRQAAFVCAIGQYCRSQLMKLSDPEQWEKFEVSPLGVDPQVFQPVADKPAGEDYRIICVGRLVAAKGQAVLLQALARMQDASRKTSLTLVGDGPDRALLERVAAQLGILHRVTFTGSVNQDQIRDLYRQADLFVLPSFAEGIPVVLMEAMAMEIPCVSTTITGIPELITSGAEGLLVPPSDSEQLAAAIVWLRLSPDFARSLARKARLKVIRRYHLQKNTTRLAAILRRRIKPQPNALADEQAAA